MLRHSTGYKLANQGEDTRSLAHYLGIGIYNRPLDLLRLRLIGSLASGRIRPSIIRRRPSRCRSCCQDLLPSLSRVAALSSPANPACVISVDSARRGATALRVQLDVVDASEPAWRVVQPGL